MKKGKLCEWTLKRIRDACEKVAKDDVGFCRKSQASIGSENRGGGSS